MAQKVYAWIDRDTPLYEQMELLRRCREETGEECYFDNVGGREAIVYGRGEPATTSTRAKLNLKNAIVLSSEKKVEMRITIPNVGEKKFNSDFKPYLGLIKEFIAYDFPLLKAYKFLDKVITDSDPDFDEDVFMASIEDADTVIVVKLKDAIGRIYLLEKYLKYSEEKPGLREILFGGY